jgi:hypothetical protein
MRFILFSLLALVNGYILPKHSSIIMKNKCFNDEYIYLKNKIRKLETIRNKILILTEQNLKNIKEIVEEEYSTEWDYHNRTMDR